ncbi:LysR substrate-binding domain-containing protein [Streptomyces sp. CBMA152]|uniref:LysR family transcriptional regulator n=1 Tax=Streptomyces sp. CBMA152 TaxID=1896312 RepID=UPI002948B747|nr:LysR substrate-binding domain-containing protein [Streptomyces sp. CBMA152]
MTDTHASGSSLYDVFLRVAADGSFTAAAQALGYTQSAVSRQVQTLEAELGSVLFDRLPRGVQLTEAGRVLVPHAEAVRDRLAAARAELTALRTLDSGLLRVGAFSTADAALLPRSLAAFRRLHPRVTIARTEGPSVKHLGLLASGELDIAVVSATAGRALDGCALRHLLDEPMFVAVPLDHRMAGRRRLRLAELADEEWVAGSTRPEDTLMRPVLEAGFRPRATLVVRDWIAKQGFVAAGLGVTLLPALAADSVRADIVLVPVHPDDVPHRAVYAATPHGRADSPAVAAFLAELRATARQLMERAV